jgi:RNA polymerase sigma factor (sigma-70 family)
MASERDRRISDAMTRERPRLLRFIRKRVPDAADAEDVLQDVFSALVEANRLLMPVEHVTGWLFRAARNRITDLFRKQRPAVFSDVAGAGGRGNGGGDAGEERAFADLLAAPDDGPDAAYARSVLLEQLEEALEELPPEQRDVFLAHELHGRSFKDIAAETGVNVNTLLSRKRYAVLHLRERLQDLYDELTRARTK